MKKKVTTAFPLALIMVLLVGIPAFAAYDNKVIYTGQGLTKDEIGGYTLDTEICGTENGAEVDGPYLLWVLTATKATKAEIKGPWGTEEMFQSGNGGGAFKFVSEWYDPNTLTPDIVFATYDGVETNAQLVVSHGCRPYKKGAWCSPGFWKNAEDAAWAKTGNSKTSPFNTTVYPVFYGATFLEDPTLYGVLTAPNPSPYKGSPVAGTSGYELNAYNAVGAYLTNQIPGYQFDWDVMVEDGSEACPLDHSGDLKLPYFLYSGEQVSRIYIPSLNK